MVREPSYYRARLSTCKHFISQSNGSKDKSSPYELLKYGVVHTDIAKEFESYLSNVFENYTFSKLPLEFSELCSFNTWFAMHPEKIAGKEFITTSREFPVTIKGTKEDILQTIGTKPRITKNINSSDRIRIAKAKASAKLKLLHIIAI